MHPKRRQGLRGLLGPSAAAACVLVASVTLLNATSAWSAPAPLEAASVGHAASTPSWKVSSLTNFNALSRATTNAISCASASSCVLGGEVMDAKSAGHAYVSNWNGTSWTDRELGFSATHAGGSVNAAACPAVNTCVVGGRFTVAGVGHPLVSVWNGTSWTDHELEATLNRFGGAVTALSCDSATSCMAIGTYVGSDIRQHAFASTWNGTSWSDQELSIDLGVTASPWPTSVSCATASSCVVVGWARTSDPQLLGFASVWNGSSWSVSELGKLGKAPSRNVFVNSVDCASRKLCVAGGQYRDANQQDQGFVSVWNGHTWKDVDLTTKIRRGYAAEIASVSCPTRKFCLAGGSVSESNQNNPMKQVLVASWNGRTWTKTKLAKSLNPGGQAQTLSVSCFSASSCAVGGRVMDTSSTLQAFGATWNGRTWKAVAIAADLNTGGSGELAAVACVARGSCVAAGQYAERGGHDKAFVAAYGR